MADKKENPRMYRPNKEDLTVEELKSTHELYDLFIEEWDFLYAAYQGTKALLDLGCLLKHERETPENFKNRVKSAYGFAYTTSIVDILNFYLNKKAPKREVPDKVQNDVLYTSFLSDANLEGDGLDEFLTEASRLASIMGFVGCLVDKANVELRTRQEQIDNQVYPYLSQYFPQAILDWTIERNEFGRPTLTMIKLYNNDQTYTIWFQDHFEIWDIPKDQNGEELIKNTKANLISSLSHNLGEIPFVFIVNKKWRKRPIGKSDVSDIARIDVSIIRNLSQGEEIIDYSAFPMMRKPFEEGRPDQQVEKNTDVGPTAILGFDPDNPDSKPDWLPSESDAPMKALIDWILMKIAEVYRSSNVGGLAATEVQTQAKSGTALQTEFQLLNSTLVRKAINLEKAERIIHWLFYKWEYPLEAKKLIDETKVERERTYDVENLAMDLDNIITSKTIVISQKFNEAMQKKTVRMMLPSWTENNLKEIDDEIEKSIVEETKEKENFDPFGEKKDQLFDKNGDAIEPNEEEEDEEEV